MSTRITIAENAEQNTICVSIRDDTGRYQNVTMPKASMDPSYQAYLEWAEPMDAFMHQWEDRRGGEKGQPVTSSSSVPTMRGH